MEDLLVRSVRRAPDNALTSRRRGQVLDMGQDYVGRFPIYLGVLPAAHWGNVRGDAGVDRDVVLTGVGLYAEAADDKEAVARVQFIGQATEFGVEVWQGKGFGGYVTERKAEC